MKSIVVIPTYNEEKNIGLLIKEILKLENNFDILVVDGCSTDGTAAFVKKIAQNYKNRVFLLQEKEKRGLGAAYRNGFRWALPRGYDFIIEMDGDSSHSPQYLPLFIKKMKKYDLVVGSRYLDWKSAKINLANLGIKRSFVSISANFLVKTIIGLPVKDSTSGFKCFKKDVLEKIGLDNILSSGYFFQVETNRKVQKAGFKIGEIPIIFRKRKYGKSKLSMNILKEGFFSLLKMKFSR